MYYYVYDTYLSDKKYEKVLDKVKTRLLDLEIQGKHERLTLLKSMDELITDELKKGAITVVVVGNDKTFLKVINTVAKNSITVGIIPIGGGNNIARTLGIPTEDAACDILAARKIIKFDLGKIKDQYFFSHLTIDKTLTRLSVVKDNYKMTPSSECVELNVYNFCYNVGDEDLEPVLKKISPQDGYLELVFKIKEKSSGWFKKSGRLLVDSIIKGKKFEIKSFEYIPTFLDGARVIKTPFTVEIESKKLSVIVGKDRLINLD